MRQIYYGVGSDGAVRNNVVAYTSPVAPVMFWAEQAADYIKGRHIWLNDSTFLNWQIFHRTPSDVTWTYDFLVNAGATALTITIPAGSLYGSDLVHTVDVPSGADISLRRTPTPPFNQQPSSIHPTVYFTLEADHVDPTDQISLYGTNAVGFVGGSNTYNTPLFNPDEQWSGSTLFWESRVIHEGGNLLEYAVQLDDTPVNRAGPTGQIVFAIVVNGVVQDGSGATVDTRITLTTTSLGIWSGTLPLTDCQRVRIRAVLTGFGSSDAVRIATCVKFAAAVANKFWVGGTDGGTSSNAAVEYIEFLTSRDHNDGFSVTEASRVLQGAVTPMTLTGLCIFLQDNPGSGRSWTFEPRVNGVSVGPSLTISGGGLSASTPTGDWTINRNDTWSFQKTPAGSPQGANGINWVSTGEAPTPEPPLECPGDLGPERADGLPYAPVVPPACAGAGTRGVPRIGA